MPLANIIRNLGTGVLVLTISITGCAAFRQVKIREVKPSTSEIVSTENGWWFARFRIPWAPDTVPLWHLDLFLGHQVVLPVLNQYKDDIDLWRFHRRAVRDNTGHQFSFIFFSSALTAHKIFQEFMDNDLLKEMKAAGLIIDAIYDDTGVIAKPNIEDTSDKHWSPFIQETWPYYIMGVSQMWLNLVADVAQGNSTGEMPSTIPQIEEFYRQVNASVTALWEKEGRHAFLHHLNAIFGYEPVIVYEKRFLNF